jgi:hypothetical protein
MARRAASRIEPLVVAQAPLRELVVQAMRIGAERAVALADWRHAHVTRDGWLRCCVELAGLQDVAELQALRERIKADTPRLAMLCRMVARSWATPIARDGQPPTDRPAPARDFEDSEREGPAWTERVMNRVSTAEASAVAGLLAVEAGRGWGYAAHPDEPRLRLEAWARELRRLQDRMLAISPTWADLTEGPGGAVLVAGVALLPAGSLAERAAAQAAVRTELQHAA